MNKTLSKAVLTIVFSLVSLSVTANTYSFTILDGLDDGSTFAYSINNFGQIVGNSASADGNSRATLWNNGVTTQLTNPQGILFSNAYSINDLGHIVGSTQTESGYSYATLWSDGLATVINSQGTVNSINNLGQIVGSTQTESGYSYATLWNDGVATQLTNPQGIVFSNAASINNLGQIVGVSLTEDFMARAVLWDNGLEIDLNSFLTASEQSEGWVLTYAIDINDSGSIVGGAINTVSNVERGFLLQSALQPQSAFLLQIVSSVPEADTPVMLLIGLGVVGFMARRRKNIQA